MDGDWVSSPNTGLDAADAVIAAIIVDADAR